MYRKPFQGLVNAGHFHGRPSGNVFFPLTSMKKFPRVGLRLARPGLYTSTLVGYLGR